MECLSLPPNATLGSLTQTMVQHQGPRLAMLFYMVDPNSTAYQHPEEVPDYFTHVSVTVAVLVLLEMVVKFVDKNADNIRINDCITSLGSAVIFMASTVPSRGLEIMLYQAVYSWRLFTFDWSSAATWWVAAITADFLFYWFHRFAHETNIGWAGHQVHHGSEDYNLPVSLRQSAILKMYTILFYLPLAMAGVPVTAVLVHTQLNVIYQLWLHTEVVPTLGPLEWVLNTPSHHRVHHGSEPWCLDKNYAGVLIIWDRLFGTFQQEIKDKKIIYGHVTQPQSFNNLYLETFYYRTIYHKVLQQDTFTDKLKAVFYGPGWSPGSPRLGHPLPDPPADQPPRKKYDPILPLVHHGYLFLHLFLAALVQQEVRLRYHSMSSLECVCNTLLSLVTMGCIGTMYDGHPSASTLELVRCTLSLLYCSIYPVFRLPLVDRTMQAMLALSVVIWSLHNVKMSRWKVKLM